MSMYWTLDRIKEGDGWIATRIHMAAYICCSFVFGSCVTRQATPTRFTRYILPGKFYR